MEPIQDFNKIIHAFNIKASCIDFKEIDNYFYYDLHLSPNAKVKDISKYSDEISLALKTPCKPSIKVLHGAGIVRLEFVTTRKSKLNLFDYFTNKKVPKGDIMCLLGQSVDGERMWMDLAKNPHMIISGTTGSGKSTLLHNIIANLLNYNKVQLYLVDPKNIEFTEYSQRIKKNIHVSHSYAEALFTLDTLLALMERRYELLRSGLDAINLPNVVLIVDEFADLIIQDKDNQFYTKLCKLAQKCRAAKINIILATQRPSVDIINGTIKANFAARIACRVASHVDSKVILDASGAENLIGNGDALLRDGTRYLERFQVAYTDAHEVCNIFGE